MKSAFLLSKAHFSLHSRKNISCADSNTLCAFWQQVASFQSLALSFRFPINL
jgi:hypothetical protein